MAPAAVDTSHPTSFTPYYSRGLRERFRIDGLKPLVLSAGTSNLQADIDYEVDEAQYLARTKARARIGTLEKDLPAGWPKRLNGPLVWSGTDFPDESEYVYFLTDEDKAEVFKALEHFKDQELNGDEVNRDNFPLGNLGKQLERVRDKVYEGPGFVVLRGLDTDAFLIEDLTIVCLGISSYIAERRGKQDQRGSMMMHVMNRDSVPERNKDNLEKPFHTDTVCDCLCLVARSCSAKGGRSILASGWAVYNELAATRPDLIHVLARPDWPFDTHGRYPPYYQRSLLYFHEGKIIFNFSRRLLVGHPPLEPRTQGIPGLNEAQAEALDTVHFVARKHEIRTRIEKGDIRFLNNMGMLHRREAFEDDAITQRHLIRLWLNNEMMCWKLPRPLRLAWARVFEDGDRDAHWDMEPPRMNGKLLRVAGSCD